MPEFHLVKRRVGADQTLELLPEQFRKIVIAQNALQNALALEQKYAILTSNYSSLKNTCAEQCRKWCVGDRKSYSSGSEKHLAINTALLNYLSSGRMYVDQSIKDIESCEYEIVDASSSISSIRSRLYDEHKEYAFLEWFRNHCQHASIPKLNLKFKEKINGNEIHNSLDVTIKKNPLYKSKKVKKKVVDPMPNRIDIVNAVDIHFSCLQVTHHETRKLISTTLENAEIEVGHAHSMFSEAHGNSTIGLRARVKKDNDKIRSIPLSLEWNEVRKELQESRETSSIVRVHIITTS